MRRNMTKVVLGLIVAAVLCLAGCGGGGSSSSNDASSTVSVAKQGTWTGKYSSVDTQSSGSVYSDIEVLGSSINKMYVNGVPFGTIPQSIPLQKKTEFTGNAYQSTDGNNGIFFDSSGNHMAMIYGSKNVAVYQTNSIANIIPQKEDINGVWGGSVFAKSDRDGLIHQYQTQVTCQNQVCTFDQGVLSIDFARPSYSNFYPEGTWYGRETNSGPRFLTTALMSGDLQFMIMPLCWSSFTIGIEGFFDICQAAVLSKTSAPLVNTANAGINQNVITGSLVNLNGSGTAAASGGLTYLWRIVSMPAGSFAVLSSTNLTNPIFTADRQGTYILGLTVSNSGFDSIESTMTVTATDPVFIIPQLVNFKAAGAVRVIVLTWDDPGLTKISYIEVFRNTIDNIGSAQLVGTTAASAYSDNNIPNSAAEVIYYYWVRAVSDEGIKGPFNSTAGTPGVCYPNPI